MTENLFRRNVWHNFTGPVGGGGDTAETVGIQNTRLVNETHVDNVLGIGSAPYDVVVRNIGATGAPINSSWYFNNINDNTWSSGLTTNIQVFSVGNTPWAEWTGANYNLAFEEGVTLGFAANWTNQANEQSNVDPVFVDKANDDFRLQVTSGAIGNAGPLTATSGTGTGTTFSVAAGGGGFFRGPNADIAQYGGNLTEGDAIGIGSDCRTVVSVSGDNITVDSSFTWADAEPVYYGCDTTPDIGAYPYKAGGYTLSATYAGGATKTITPNDASLVRFVVCYDSNAPYEVDNSSPYTCAAPSGTFSARVYPRYASQTLWAEAQAGGAPENPGRGRGRRAFKRPGL